MIKQIATLALVGIASLSSVACGYPGPREAQVVVKSHELMEPTREAIQRWQIATHGDINWTIVDACDDGVACVTVEKYRIRDGAWGLTTHVHDAMQGANNFAVFVHPNALNPDLAPPGTVEETLTHEFGHVLGLDHNDNAGDSEFPEVMRSKMGPTSDSCITSHDLHVYNEFNGSHVPTDTVCF